ncbi:hypothetical protein [Rhodoblastus sp.]|uniref:hypothetical protein n=1 Tax=Rhodoblastus sp. TaxID=1962975 RepID=UPI0025D8099C|nr:hypothetical protein [Rhodoblastus sp.]
MRSYLRLAMVMMFCTGVAHAANDDILFSGKLFFDTGEVIRVAGTLTGDGLGYPNNSYSIICIEARKECLVTSVEQIGVMQVGRVEYPYAVPITRWTSAEVVAEEDISLVGCVRTTIFIERKSEQVRWVEEPVNQALAFCARSNGAVHRFTIEDSLGEKKMRAK